MIDTKQEPTSSTSAGGGGDTAATGGATAATAAQQSAAAGPAAGRQADAPALYAAAGEAFTIWFNSMLGRTPNPTIRLGTKTATVVGLHEDGRLEVSLHASAGEQQQQFVAFESVYLDQLLRKFAAIGT